MRERGTQKEGGGCKEGERKNRLFPVHEAY